MWLVQVIKSKWGWRMTAVQDSSAHSDPGLLKTRYDVSETFAVGQQTTGVNGLVLILGGSLKPYVGCSCWHSSGLFLAYFSRVLQGCPQPSENFHEQSHLGPSPKHLCSPWHLGSFKCQVSIMSFWGATCRDDVQDWSPPTSHQSSTRNQTLCAIKYYDTHNHTAAWQSTFQSNTLPFQWLLEDDDRYCCSSWSSVEKSVPWKFFREAIKNTNHIFWAMLAKFHMTRQVPETSTVQQLTIKNSGYGTCHGMV